MAEHSEMHHSIKADLLACLEPLAPHTRKTPEVDVKIFDGAALVHSLDTTKSNVETGTFDDYANRIFIPYLTRELKVVERLDVICDEYRQDGVR